MPAADIRSIPPDSTATPTSSRRVGILKLAVFAFVIAGAALLARQLGLLELTDRAALLVAVDRARSLSLLIPAFVVVYALAVTFGLPASPLTLAGGALFGFWNGVLFNWLGATIGATLAYLSARTLCGPDCRALLGDRATSLERMAADHGFMGTLRLRLIPVVPFSLLNYAAALAGVLRRGYLLATAIGIVSGSAVYTYFADSLLQGAAGARDNALLHVAVAGALLLLLSFVPSLVRRVRGDLA